MMTRPGFARKICDASIHIYINFHQFAIYEFDFFFFLAMNLKLNVKLQFMTLVQY